MRMDIDQHVRELLKAMAEGVYEKEHILAMTLLSAVAGESIQESCGTKAENDFQGWTGIRVSDVSIQYT